MGSPGIAESKRTRTHVRRKPPWWHYCADEGPLVLIARDVSIRNPISIDLRSERPIHGRRYARSQNRLCRPLEPLLLKAKQDRAHFLWLSPLTRGSPVNVVVPDHL